MSVLKLIAEVGGSLVSFVVLLLLLIGICRRICSIWRKAPRQPVVDGNRLNEIPLADTEADVGNVQNNVILNVNLSI